MEVKVNSSVSVEAQVNALENLNEEINKTQRQAMSVLDDTLRRISQEYMKKKLKELKAKNGKNRNRRLNVNDDENELGQQNIFDSNVFLHDFGKIDETEKKFFGISEKEQQGSLIRSKVRRKSSPDLFD